MARRYFLQGRVAVCRARPAGEPDPRAITAQRFWLLMACFRASRPEAGHLGELVAVEPQRIHVAVDEVPDIKKTPSGLNAMSSAETAHFGMADLFSYRS